MTRGQNKYQQKRGGEFSLSGTLALPAPDGAWTVTSMVKDASGESIADLNVVLGTGVARVGVSPPIYDYPILLWLPGAETIDWELGTLQCDTRAEDERDPDPVVWPSPTFFIEVVENITTPPVP